MSAFANELTAVHAAVLRANPTHPNGIYAVPFYMVVGLPGSGRSTALHALGLTWEGNDGPLQTGFPQQLCTYWMPKEGLFIEPEATVLGPGRRPEGLKQLCDDLRSARPREPLDGLLVVVNIADFIDRDEHGIEEYANEIRRYLIEIGQRLRVEVPTYVVLTRYDTVWGFAEVFQWSADRTREDPWGFALPLDTAPQESLPRIREQLDGLNARLEAFCLSKLCSEEPPELRIRAFQHLAEVRALMEKLGTVFTVLAAPNAFERAPWIRAVAIGSAVPGGGGDRLRASVARFFNMGLAQGPTAPVSARPGGLPLHAFMTSVILPERDIVPLRTRWRDDKVFLLCAIFAGLLWVITVISAVVLSVTATAPREAGTATGAPGKVVPARAPVPR